MAASNDIDCLTCNTNDNNEITAFHNVCSHRCLKLIDEKKNIGKIIRCPYHAWSYDLEGKLKAAPHQEFSSDKFSSEKAIKDNISKLQDLYGRNHKYKKVPIDDSYPKFFQENSDKFKDYIL